MGLVVKGLVGYFGIEVAAQINTDSSAAKKAASGMGAGKV